MSTLPQDFILSQKHSLDTAHETSSFTIQVTIDFLFKGGLVQVSRADCDTEGNGFFFGLPADILEDGKGGVNPAAFFEEGANSAARALGGNEDNIDVGWGDDTSEVFVDDREAVGEVQSLTIRLGCRGM
jgi:hypothetical protein